MGTAPLHHLEHRLALADGRRLHAQAWHPGDDGPPARSLLALVHGIGGHGGQFAPMAESLVSQGVLMCALDLPGHGRSAGGRGQLGSWQEFRQATAALLGWATELAPELPRVLLGHSLGAAVVLDYAWEHPLGLAGVVVVNPALELTGGGAWRLALARALASLWPTYTRDTGIPLAAAAHDPQVLERIRLDPLRHSRCSARLARDWEQVARQLQQRRDPFPLPLLVLQSAGDPVTCPEAAQRFVDGVEAADKTLMLYRHSLHELLDDVEQEAVLRDLLAWLRAHGA